MKTSRRKFEELTWVFGLHRTAVTVHRLLGRRGGSEALVSFYSRLLPPKALVFDIGANVGMYSEALEKAGATVVALEPNADCVRHIELTYPGRRIEVIHAAAGSKAGLATFHLSDDHDDTSTMDSKWVEMIQREYQKASKEWRKVTVPVVTLDSLIEHYGVPFYIKLDVEGYEPTVLDGLGIQPPLMSIEYHGANFDGAIECLDKPIISRDSAFNLTNEAGSQFEFSRWLGRAELVAALEKLRGNLTYRDLYISCEAGVVPTTSHAVGTE